MSSKTRFVGNLEDQLVAEVVANHRQRLEAAGFYSSFDIEVACEALLDSKIFDIEDSIDEELFVKVKKAAGY